MNRSESPRRPFAGDLNSCQSCRDRQVTAGDDITGIFRPRHPTCPENASDVEAPCRVRVRSVAHRSAHKGKRYIIITRNCYTRDLERSPDRKCIQYLPLSAAYLPDIAHLSPAAGHSWRGPIGDRYKAAPLMSPLTSFYQICTHYITLHLRSLRPKCCIRHQDLFTCHCRRVVLFTLYRGLLIISVGAAY